MTIKVADWREIANLVEKDQELDFLSVIQTREGLKFVINIRYEKEVVTIKHLDNRVVYTIETVKSFKGFTYRKPKY